MHSGGNSQTWKLRLILIFTVQGVQWAHMGLTVIIMGLIALPWQIIILLQIQCSLIHWIINQGRYFNEIQRWVHNSDAFTISLVGLVFINNYIINNYSFNLMGCVSFAALTQFMYWNPSVIPQSSISPCDYVDFMLEVGRASCFPSVTASLSEISTISLYHSHVNHKMKLIRINDKVISYL